MLLTCKTLFMSNLEYSVEAAEAKGLFYNKNFTVYVEGEDDVMFWNKLFGVAEVDAHIEEVGGNEEIRKKVGEILDNNASFIVACDSDHSDFIDPKIEHSQIIKTYGYSIENSMFTTKNLEDAIQKLGKSPKAVRNEIETWAEEFSNGLHDLIVYDVANHIYDKGIQVFGNNCQRFLKSGTSKEICSDSISAFIDSIKEGFTNEEIDNVKNLIGSTKKDLWFHLKGHFVTHGVINLIQYFVKNWTGSKCNLPFDSLYALTIDCGTDWKLRTDIKPVVEKIEKLKNSA